MSLRVERLDRQSLAGFSCGNDELDEWLALHATPATGHGIRTYLLINAAERVVGYFSLAPHLLRRGEAPRRLTRGASGNIPAVLLAKFALDTTLHGEGLGAELLVRALETILGAAREVGGRVIVVDAIDAAARSFYERHDFQPLPGAPHRLVMKMSTAARALNIDWP